jgi:hypothetical protein
VFTWSEAWEPSVGIEPTTCRLQGHSASALCRPASSHDLPERTAQQAVRLRSTPLDRQEEVPAAAAELRLRAAPAADRAWPLPWFGATFDSLASTAARSDELLEDGFGRSARSC